MRTLYLAIRWSIYEILVLSSQVLFEKLHMLFRGVLMVSFFVCTRLEKLFPKNVLIFSEAIQTNVYFFKTRSSASCILKSASS